ncbi:MAG: helix-turn-helix domain-containing protein [Clostridiales bacterium]|nr:helix-turn-helix domain-containing protein [Clostridiales bacterium]
MDGHLLMMIEQVIKRLNTPITVLDADGNCLIPKEDIRFAIPTLSTPGEAVLQEGRLYQLCTADTELVLMSPKGDDDLVRDTFTLCDAMIGAAAEAVHAGTDVNYVYQRILQNEMSLGELDAMVDEHHLTDHAPRCVLLLHMVQVQQSSALDILSEVVPRSANDTLVAMDKHTVALIKDVSGMEDVDEMRQFALALQETLLSEVALNVTVGIGNVAESISDLHESYRQARRAMDIGRLYSPDESIHVYRSMLLDRFLSDLPPETAEHYHALLFNRSTARLFSDEMLYTIEMFFKKDLNLSDTARQLYIHRNTLVYRLDKVQRQVGLDLRKFEDAVTFKMLLEMRKCGNNKNRAKAGR